MKRIVIVGGGQAGLSCAAKLRDCGFQGAIDLVGEELDPPYQRPPLSKAYLLGKLSADRLLLRPLTWYEDNEVTLRNNVSVCEIDRVNKTVTLSDDTNLQYDKLVLATGAAARPLPSGLVRGLKGIHTIRTRADIEGVRPKLGAAKNVLVVGGGYVGLEMAAVARELGRNVTIIEAAADILGRVACHETARFIANLHRDRGVAFELGQGVEAFLGSEVVTGAQLTSGEHVPADLVIVGIGALPRTELAETAELETENGILVNASGQTSDPSIYAVGDCANYRLHTGDLRLESVGNAIDTGELIAQNILDKGLTYKPMPWFWSDQYNLKLQIAGQSKPGDLVVVRNHEKEGRSHWYFREGIFVAVDAFNSPSSFLMGKRWLQAGQTPDPETLKCGDVSIRNVGLAGGKPSP